MVAGGDEPNMLIFGSRTYRFSAMRISLRRQGGAVSERSVRQCLRNGVDLGGFWPVRPGSDSMLYFALRGPLSASRLNGYLSWEIAVSCSTPGFLPRFWVYLMGSGDLTRAERLIEDILRAYASAGLLSKVQDEAYRNSLRA